MMFVIGFPSDKIGSPQSRLTAGPSRCIKPKGYLTNRFTQMPPDRLDATLAALADPTRRAILARLALGETSVTELAEPFAMSLPAVSKHLKVLERAGLIARGRDAQRRPCRLEAAPLKDVANWVAHYRRFWDESLDRLDDYLQKLQAKESKRGRRK
jgi:DNA-binding transcriptional ArsR family regulator